MKDYICPLCDKEMVEEEGLWWCDACGINNDSITYKKETDNKDKFRRDQKKWERED